MGKNVYKYRGAAKKVKLMTKKALLIGKTLTNALASLLIADFSKAVHKPVLGRMKKLHAMHKLIKKLNGGTLAAAKKAWVPILKLFNPTGWLAAGAVFKAGKCESANLKFKNQVNSGQYIG